MKVNTAVQVKKRTIQAAEMLWQNAPARRLLFQAACFVSGLLLSHASVFGAYSPFGVAAAAALPYGGMPLGALGGAVGYLSLGSTSAMRYIAALVAVCGIRWTLNDLKNIKNHPLFAPLIAGIPVLATGLAILSITGRTARFPGRTAGFVKSSRNGRESPPRGWRKKSWRKPVKSGRAGTTTTSPWR